MMEHGIWCILLVQFSQCSEQIGEFLTDPGAVCEGQKTTLTCILNRTSLVWKYSDQIVGLPISSPHQSYTITIGLLGHFFDKSVYSLQDNQLRSSLSFAPKLDMNGERVKCEGPNISFIQTIRIITQGLLPNVSSPKVLSLTPGINTYTTIVRWNITVGSKLPTVQVEPSLSNGSVKVMNISYSMLVVNITTLYSVRYLINISSQNCNGRTSRKYELYKVGYCDLPPDPPLHGNVDPIKDKYSQGEVVIYYCSKEDENYRQTTCTLDGTWTPNPSALNCKVTGTKKWFIGLVAGLGLLATIFVVATVSICIIGNCGKTKVEPQIHSSSIPGSRATSRLNVNVEQEDNRNSLAPERHSIPKLQVERPSVVLPVVADVEPCMENIQRSPSSGDLVNAGLNLQDNDADRFLHLTAKHSKELLVHADVTPLEVMSIENSNKDAREQQHRQSKGAESPNVEATVTEDSRQSARRERISPQPGTGTEEAAPITDDTDSQQHGEKNLTHPASEDMTMDNAQLATEELKVGKNTYKIEVQVHTESGATIQAEILPGVSEALAVEEERKSVASTLGSQDGQKEKLKGRDQTEDMIELHDMIQEKPDSDIQEMARPRQGSSTRSQEDEVKLGTHRTNKSTSTSRSSRDGEQTDMLATMEEVDEEKRREVRDTEPTKRSDKGSGVEKEVDATAALDTSTHKESAGPKASKEQDISASPKPVKRTKSGTTKRQDSKARGKSKERISGRDHPSTGEEDSDVRTKKTSPKGKHAKKIGLAQESNLLSSEASGSVPKIIKKTSGKQRGRSLHRVEKESTAAQHSPSPPRITDVDHSVSSSIEQVHKMSNTKVTKTKKTKSPNKE